MTLPVLIIGGGIAGLQAADAIAKSGANAIVVEQAAIIGGPRAALFNGNNNCIALNGIDALESLHASENIETLTLCETTKVERKAGHFNVTLRQQARFVSDACTLCNHCVAACPQVIANEFDAGIHYRKAIHTPTKGATPSTYVIDIENCLNVPPNYLPCQHCVEVCDDNAIHFDMPLRQHHDYAVSAIIVANGFGTEDNQALDEFGLGLHPDIINTLELQRLLESPGPTGGYVAKLSNEEYPESMILVLQRVLPLEAHIIATQIDRLLEQDIDDVCLLILEQENSETLEDLIELQNNPRITVLHGAWLGVDTSADNALTIRYIDLSTNTSQKRTADMLVLSSVLCPATDIASLAEICDIELNAQGYVNCAGSENLDTPNVTTSQEGIFAAGCATGPVNIADSLAQAQEAARAALAYSQPMLSSNDRHNSEINNASSTIDPQSEKEGEIERMLELLFVLGSH